MPILGHRRESCQYRPRGLFRPTIAFTGDSRSSYRSFFDRVTLVMFVRLPQQPTAPPATLRIAIAILNAEPGLSSRRNTHVCRRTYVSPNLFELYSPSSSVRSANSDAGSRRRQATHNVFLIVKASRIVAQPMGSSWDLFPALGLHAAIPSNCA